MGAISTLRLDREALQTGWIEENKLRMKEATKRNVREWLAWSLAAVGIITAGVLGIRLAVEHGE